MIPAVEHLASFRWDEAGVRRAHQAINAAMHAEVEYLQGFAA
ncbi:MAG: hypothetical protein ACXV5Q_07395 [Frankiaceae bacterium]